MDDANTEERFQENVKWISRNGVGIQIMETMAVGALLTAYAIQLGASNLVIGVLAAIPHLSQLAQIPAIFLVEKVRKRRMIYGISGLIARPMMLVIGCAAFLPSDDALSVIMIAFAIRYAAGAFLSCSWSSWMRDLIPDERMGAVFSKRQQTMIGVGIVLTLVTAAIVDNWTSITGFNIIYAFTFVYCLSFLGGIYGVWAAKHVDEPPMPEQTLDVSFLKQLLTPFKDQNYRKLIGFMVSWNFAINLAAPFFTVHMLKKMDLDLMTVMGFAIVSQVTAYIMVAQWGNLADRFSNKSVLAVCAPLFVIAVFSWTFTTMPDPHAFTLPLLLLIHIATGAASAGVTLAAGNLTLKLAPRGAATAYLGTNALVNAISASTASMIGGLTADFFTSIELSVIVRWADAGATRDFSAINITNWDFFFLFATVLGLYALHRLSHVVEKGDVEEQVVINTLFENAWQGLRGLSTVSGLRAATDFPILSPIRYVARTIRRRR